jgi:hypothetical protein
VLTLLTHPKPAPGLIMHSTLSSRRSFAANQIRCFTKWSPNAISPPPPALARAPTTGKL